MEKHTQQQQTAKVTVNRKATELTATNVTTIYNVYKDLLITLKDSSGNAISNASVTVDLNGEKEYTTDENGQIIISTEGLPIKSYTATISFAGDKNHNGSSTNATVTIQKASVTITAKAKTFKYEDKTKKYTITLKDNKGNVLKNRKLTLKVNGKTYTATTNSKGNSKQKSN